jgi:3-deoxy-D-manno-octulosonate cytidylyltransferase
MTELATVAIPARLHSSRLPRKVLADLGGRTMLRRTYDVAVAAECGPVLVLTDSEEVADEVRSFGGAVRLTSPLLESGTARIAAALDAIDSDVVVNLQADSPLVDPAVVAAAGDHLRRTRAPVAMPVYPLTDEVDVHDASVVKVVRTATGRVLYCSRSPVPHPRDSLGEFWGHVGLYAYGRDFLAAFASLPPSRLEETEKLEQLRWLEAGIRVESFEVRPQGPSVDTPADLERVRSTFAVKETL